jgi:hypothetical protein
MSSSGQGFDYSNSLSTSSNSTVTIVGDFSNNVASTIPWGTYTTNSTYSSQPKIDIKRCRNCVHAHIEGQVGCIEVMNNMVFYKECFCQEYIPSDNLEYLEYLYKKKESQ